ncbi:hypothetical protein I7I50_07887 [Histoplasma capsulatum G186AR]|uniref:Uncharacterized protein n=1 Tax=Ajellomyces capsulatus TaxID=5037 RepID=A0A8H7YJX1_AJECA|nr:hypothetical protein I7I52_08403 [Histoplasma capsulatum]QSS68465.1 hypothetical protein I7I50_07887 [Histoplasma capsulatum G186AR]
MPTTGVRRSPKKDLLSKEHLSLGPFSIYVTFLWQIGKDNQADLILAGNPDSAIGIEEEFARILPLRVAEADCLCG